MVKTLDIYLLQFDLLDLHRWEAHIWVKEIGRQVYLGGYEGEEHAAEAYDVAALKCKVRNGRLLS